MARVMAVIEAHVLGEEEWLAASEVCRLCRLEASAILELAALGVVPSREALPGVWQVPAAALPRLRVIGRLMTDLGVNVSGAALAVELLEAQRELERRLSRLERLVADH